MRGHGAVWGIGDKRARVCAATGIGCKRGARDHFAMGRSDLGRRNRGHRPDRFGSIKSITSDFGRLVLGRFYRISWIMDDRILKYINLALLGLYPIAWFAPLISAGLLPIFGMDQISILSGIISMWDSDPFLGAVVFLFAIAAPAIKTLSNVIADFFGKALLPPWAAIGLARFAMADVFLIALYLTVIKGIGVGRLTTEWGLYVFTLCVIVSVLVTVRRH